MQIEITILIAIGTFILGVIGTISISKRNSNTDGVQFGRVLEKLEQMDKKIDKLENVYSLIDEKLNAHENRYHAKGV